MDAASLHIVDTGPRGTGRPLIYVPGISGTAEEDIFLSEAFASRRCICVSMRGRGQSPTPPTGYGVEHHGKDLAALVDRLQLRAGGYHLHGYSIGAMYALSFLDQRPACPPASVILGDHPGQVGKLPTDWAASFGSLVINGRPVTANIRREALDGMVADSRATSFYGRSAISGLRIPALLLRGSAAGKPPSAVSDADVEEYSGLFPVLEVAKFPKAGHFLRDTHRQKYLDVLGDFMGRFDA